MIRPALKYDSLTGTMHVRRFDDDVYIDSDSKIVPIDALRRIGDCDIDNLILEAMSSPGLEVRLPKVKRTINHLGGLRRAA